MIHTKELLYIAKGPMRPPNTLTDVVHNNMQSAITWDSQEEVDFGIKSLESHYSKKSYILFL